MQSLAPRNWACKATNAQLLIVMGESPRFWCPIFWHLTGRNVNDASEYLVCSRSFAGLCHTTRPAQSTVVPRPTLQHWQNIGAECVDLAWARRANFLRDRVLRNGLEQDSSDQAGRHNG